MKLLPIVTLAVMLVAACSRTDAPPSETAATPPAAETAAAPEAPPATPPTADQAGTTGQLAPAAASSAAATAARPETPPAAASTSAAAAPAPAPVAPPAPVEPPKPKFRAVTIPAGTALSVTVLSNLGSATSAVEDPVRGALAQPVVIGGSTALPSGAEVRGTVTEVSKSGRVKGRASVAFRFDRLLAYGETHDVATARVIQEAGKDTKSDVKKGGVGAGLGAVVGGIAGGGKGAAIGAVAGGAGTVLATKGGEVEIPAGTVVEVLVQEALTVQVPVK